MVTLHRVHEVEHMLFDPGCSCLFARMYSSSSLVNLSKRRAWSLCVWPIISSTTVGISFRSNVHWSPPQKNPKVAHQEHSKRYARLLSFFFFTYSRTVRTLKWNFVLRPLISWQLVCATFCMHTVPSLPSMAPCNFVLYQNKRFKF